MIEAGGEPMQSEYAQALGHVIKRLEDPSTPKDEKATLGRSKGALISELIQHNRPNVETTLDGIKDITTRARVEELLSNIPPNLRNRYLKRIQGTFSESDDIARESGLGGVVFELERINELVKTKSESIDFNLQPLKIDFLGFNKKNTWGKIIDRGQIGDSPMELIEGSSVDFDVPITRNGKPYIYEVKKYGRMPYGLYPSSINQLLKYNEAVKLGKVEGASFEFKGRINKDFVTWLKQSGDALGNVEIIYIMELPSGQEYRFVLKPSNKSKLNFVNPEITNVNDLEIVEGINRSIIDGSILEKVSNIEEIPTDVKDFVVNPMKSIKTKDQLKKYEEFVRLQIYKNLKKPSN